MKHRILALFLATAALAPLPALGCAACFGKSDSPLAQGMNWGIFSLLAVVTVMLSAIASFFVFIVRRADQMPAEGQSVDPSLN